MPLLPLAHRIHFRTPWDNRSKTNGSQASSKHKARTKPGGVRIAAYTIQVLQVRNAVHAGAQGARNRPNLLPNDSRNAKERAKTPKEKGKESSKRRPAQRRTNS